jgi:hypothetical protein
MLLNSIQIYAWPSSLLKELERIIRNFIWSGDSSKRKLVTVTRSKVYKPLNEGGLGLRSSPYLNKGANIKLCWDLINSNEEWDIDILLKSRVPRNNKTISYYIFSSLWSSIKDKYPEIMQNSSWLLGEVMVLAFIYGMIHGVVLQFQLFCNF